MARTVKKPDVRRQEIVEAAQKLFLEQTYDNTTTNDVMKTLGIAKGTIYHYFSSKSALLDAVVEHMATEYLERRLPALETCTDGALARIACLFARDTLNETEKDTIERLHQAGNVTLHARLLAVLVELMSPVFGRLIAEGVDEGVFATDHPLEVAELLLAGIQFLTDEGVHAWRVADLERRAKAFPAIADRLMGAEPGSFSFLM